MADIYLSDSGGTRNWTDTATWAGGVVPGSTDVVHLDSTSAALVINTDVACASFEAVSYYGTISGAGSLTVGNYGDLGHVQFSGAYVTWTGTLHLGVTGATVYVSAGVALNAVTVDGGTVYLSGALNCGALTFNGGVFGMDGSSNNAGYTHVIGSFASATSNSRALYLGMATITVTGGGTSWSVSNVTGLTVDGGTSSLILPVCSYFLGGSLIDYYSVKMSAVTCTMGGGRPRGLVWFDGGGTVSLGSSTAIVGDLTVTGGTNLVLAGNMVVAAMTLTGTATNRVLIYSNVLGTRRTVTATTLVASYADFRDIAGSGAAHWNLAAITGLSGDCGGNTGITFTPSATQTWQGTSGGNWSNASKWSSRIPLPQDDVIVASAFTTGQTITVDVLRSGRNIDFSGANWSGTPLTWTHCDGYTLYGSVTLVAGMANGEGNGTTYLEGRGSHTIRTCGVVWYAGITINAYGGTYTQEDAASYLHSLVLVAGTYDANDFACSVYPGFASTSTSVRTLRMGAGTWSLWWVGSVWAIANTANLTLLAETSTIEISSTWVDYEKTFAGGGQTYHRLRVSGDWVTISGSNTFAALDIWTGGGTKGLKITSATTQTVGADQQQWQRGRPRPGRLHVRNRDAAQGLWRGYRRGLSGANQYVNFASTGGVKCLPRLALDGCWLDGLDGGRPARSGYHRHRGSHGTSGHRRERRDLVRRHGRAESALLDCGHRHPCRARRRHRRRHGSLCRIRRRRPGLCGRTEPDSGLGSVRRGMDAAHRRGHAQRYGRPVRRHARREDTGHERNHWLLRGCQSHATGRHRRRLLLLDLP